MKITFCRSILLLCFVLLSLNVQGQGNTCANAQNIASFPFTASNQTTCGKAADYSGYCGIAAGDSGGEDFIYRFTAPTTGCMKIDLTNTTGSSAITDVSFALTDGCPGAGGTTCAGSIAGKDGDNLTIKVGVTSGRVYYLTIDAESGECLNTFNISVAYMTCPVVPPLATSVTAGIDCGSNLGFESGNVSGWSGLYNDDATRYNGPPVNPPIAGFKPATPPVNGTLGGCAQSTTPANANNTATPRHTLTSGAGTDPNTNNNVTVRAPGGGNYSFRLGNQEAWYGADCIQRTFTPNPSAPIFTYLYSIISNDDGDHSDNVKARFEMSLKDPSGNPLACGGQYTVTSGARQIDGFIETTSPPCGGAGNVWYSPWRAVSVDLSSYIGQTLTIKFCASDCSGGAHYSYAYVDAYCYPKTIQGSTICATGNPVTLTAPVGFVNYQWYNGGYPVGGGVIGTGQTLTIPSPVNGAIYTVTYQNVQTGICPSQMYVTDTIQVVTATVSANISVCTG
ncbi:MAG: hypothetical protein ACT4ON_13460, partial [Bacteroidota bacterium]